MAVIFGSGVCGFAAILIGYTMAGGHIHALIHLSEFITIGGAAIGAMIISSPPKVLMDMMRSLLQFLKGTPYNKQAYFLSCSACSTRCRK